MIKAVIGSLILGVIVGRYAVTPSQALGFETLAHWALMLLMFSVGISVGTNKDVFKKLGNHHIKILIIPVGVIIGSLGGGIISALVLGMPLNEGLAIASGLGWYSLAGVLLTDLAGAEIGTIAFLSSLMREVIAFMIIPFVAKRFNNYTAIAPAAATSEDTTLPILIKYTNEEIVLIAVVNGVVCSTLVPVLINAFYQMG